jgi:hypothetical protein
LWIVVVAGYYIQVLIDWPDDFDRWYQALEDSDGPAFALATALLQAVAELDGEPDEQSATFKLVRQAKRHRLWRIAHPYQQDIAMRIICWFEDDRVVVALVGFNKAILGDVWYTSAAIRAEALVDEWRRRRQREEWT